MIRQYRVWLEIEDHSGSWWDDAVVTFNTDAPPTEEEILTAAEAQLELRGCRTIDGEIEVMKEA